MMVDLIVALDQGTTATRAIGFTTPDLMPIATARRDLPQIYPASGWVEHDPEHLIAHSIEVLREVIAATADRYRIAAIGITNQRETTLIWDRRTGKPIHNEKQVVVAP